MNFKVDEQGIYVRRCREEEFEKKATRLSRIARIALTNENVEPTYEIIYFTKNNSWSKFDNNYEFIVCRLFTSGELLDIVDKTRGISDYLGREVIINGNKFEVINDEISWNGNLYLEEMFQDSMIEAWFFDKKTNTKGYEKYRFIPRAF